MNLCVKYESSKLIGTARIRAYLTVRHKPHSLAKGTASIKSGPENRLPINHGSFGTGIKGEGSLKTYLNMDMSQNDKLIGVGNYKGNINVLYSIIDKIRGTGTLNPFLNKFVGKFVNIDSYDKLFPVRDIYLKNVIGQKDGRVYRQGISDLLDEGMFIGDYTINNASSLSLHSSEDSANTINKRDNTEFHLEVNTPYSSFGDSYVLFRVESAKALQEIYDITLNDPSGNIVCKYENISFIGDSAPTTFSVPTTINHVADHTWKPDYPVLDINEDDCCYKTLPIKDYQAVNIRDREEDLIYIKNTYCSGEAVLDSYGGVITDNYGGIISFNYPTASCFSIRFKTRAKCLDDYDSFTYGFDAGFEDCSNVYDPTIKISAVEIANSGHHRYKWDRYLPFYIEVQPTGERLKACLEPIKVLPKNFDTDVWPYTESIWKNKAGLYNTTEENQYQLAKDISARCNDSYITLENTTILDSGKLHLKFGHDEFKIRLRNGSFDLGFDCREINTARPYKEKGHDSWFQIENITLSVMAKKASGSRDYTLDVVGWSDDGLLNVTSDVGGFLQNVSGSGDSPLASGYYNEDGAIASDSYSELDQYYEDQPFAGGGGDHYKLYQNVVTSETFENYEIPLKIYEDNVRLGRSKDYSQSSFFENLFLDIYPIPSGASIASIQLCFSYKPSNALELNVLGGNLVVVDKCREEATFIPTIRQSNDEPVNLTGSGHVPYWSTIENIPHGYSVDDTLKSNYSRRWKGRTGLVGGPYDPNEFDFSFENPHLQSPFLDGHFDHSRVVSNFFLFSMDIGGSGFNPCYFGLYGSYNLQQNIGQRFRNVNTYVTNPRQSYGSIDRASKFNYVDAYSSVQKGSGVIYLSSKQYSGRDGFAAYIKFSPDEFSASNDLFGSNYFGFEDTISGVYGVINKTATTTEKMFHPYSSGDTYPLSCILTWNERGDHYGRMYVKSENSDVIKYSRGPFSIFEPSGLTLMQLGTYVHEIGLSHGIGLSGCNVLDRDLYTPNPKYREMTAQDFLEAQSVHWWNQGDSWENDTYTLSNYIDEDTCDWNMGAFKAVEFTGRDFPILTKRSGKDFVNFRLNGDGRAYQDIIDLPFPSGMDSGVSYHTQIENDFLRLPLSDSKQNFYSPSPRISKSLPRGYDFAERAFVVESIVDYNQTGVITWEDGSLGPKLIVSLYTKNKEPQDYPTENYGLINRQFHYLHPRTSWERLDSTFDYNSLIDTSESWSIFPEELRLTEFDHKYFSKDLDDMFLQYDLVVPSGSPYQVNLNIHSVNIKLENSYIQPYPVFEQLNVFTSGGYIDTGQLSLHTLRTSGIWENMPLYLYEAIPISGSDSTLLLYSSGAVMTSSHLNLYSLNYNDTSGILSLYTSGNYRSLETLNLHIFDPDNPELFVPEIVTPVINSGEPSSSSSLNLYVYNSLSSANQGAVVEQVGLRVFGGGPPIDVYKDSFLNLHTIGPSIFDERLNLILYGVDDPAEKREEQLNLYTISYPPIFLRGSGNDFIAWNDNNIGSSTEEDEDYLFDIPSTDVIRGVITTCRGACDNGGCQEQEVYTHEVDWSDAECVNGGVVRGGNVYTNSGEWAFGDVSAGRYLGHFHDTRKYTGLYPFTPYNIVVKGKTGDSGSVNPPREFEEWEYGTLGDINYSGQKLVGDEPFVESGRNLGDNYGKAVSVSRDLMAVGAPNRKLNTELGEYPDAGTVFIYRKEPVTGGQKGKWLLEEELTLPSGFITDYYQDIGGTVTHPDLGTIPRRQWYIGQEGREFGASLAAASNDNKEVLVVGGPGASWTTREFDQNITTTKINVALIAVVDEITEQTNGTIKILQTMKENNFLYRYFSDPPIEFNVKIIGIIPTGLYSTGGNDGPIDNGQMVIQNVGRQIKNQPEDVALSSVTAQRIQDAMFTAFPIQISQKNWGLPPLIGYYVDNSRSLGEEVLGTAINQLISNYHQLAPIAITDVYGVATTGYIMEYDPPSGSASEDWSSIVSDMLDTLLDTGRMVSEGYSRLVSSGLGLDYVNDNLQEFNLPPESGGRTYIFEKEFDSWTLLQELRDTSYSVSDANNRYGHAVSISDDANTIALGSPYCPDSCTIYKLDQYEKGRMYSNVGRWLEFRNESVITSGEYQTQLNLYNTLRTISGVNDSGEEVYKQLNVTDRYKLRTDYDFWGSNSIKEYDLHYTYSLTDLRNNLTGQFTVVPLSGSPTPRLGYSVALNEDGNIAAFGSPTDSLGPYDNADFYFKNGGYGSTDIALQEIWPSDDGTWASNVNAGAVRVFEIGANIQPVTERTVLEYNKFGNLSNTVNSTEGYDNNGNPTNSTAISANSNYAKTEFSDPSISDMVGTIFIITPELDAANDEVIDEIKRWMSLGDRKLVLVGDDPVWEASGAYAQSNEIINKVLDKLGSRMRLHPARNKKEALITQNCGSPFVPNVIPHSDWYEFIKADLNDALYGYGTADIRLHIPDVTFRNKGWDRGSEVVGNKKYGIPSPWNPKCGPPIAHNGDLRAGWVERELLYPIPEDAEEDVYTYWNRDVSFEFNSRKLPPVSPENSNDIAQSIDIFATDEEPRALMVAAEFTPNIGVIPEVPEIVGYKDLTQEVCYNTGFTRTYHTFLDSSIETEASIMWSASSGNYTYYNMNQGDNLSEGRFVNPDPYNGRDTLLQGFGTFDTETSVKETYETITIGSGLGIVTKEEVTGSEVFIIGQLDSENKEYVRAGNDENISLYDNMVRKPNCNNVKIIQLGGWTGTNSFIEGNSESLLANIFTLMGHEVQEGWTGNVLPASRDVAWIANANGIPSTAQTNAIKNWLALGNKKLVLTVEPTAVQSATLYKICETLGLGMKPWYLPAQDRFILNNDKKITNILGISYDNTEQTIASCDGITPLNVLTMGSYYVPINTTNGGKAIISQSADITESRVTTSIEYEDIWRINTGVAKAQFNVDAGSGYRIHYNWVSDTPGENKPLQIIIGPAYERKVPGNIAQNPATVSAGSGLSVRDYLPNGSTKSVGFGSLRKIMQAPSWSEGVYSDHVDVQIPVGVNKIDIYITGNDPDVTSQNGEIPTTCKFLSLSGVKIPIKQHTQIFSFESCVDEVIGEEEYIIQEYVPEQTVVLPATIKPVMSNNTPYCRGNTTYAGQMVADGPVVIAEEPEHFSDFIYGKERSKIVLIADSTIVNGCLGQRDSEKTTTVSGIPELSEINVLQRINSYLDTLSISASYYPTQEQIDALQTNNYTMTQKIVAPERGSPSIYKYIESGTSVTDRFGGNGPSLVFNHSGIYANDLDFDKNNVRPSIWRESTFEKEQKRVWEQDFPTSRAKLGDSTFKYGGYIDATLEEEPIPLILRESGKDFLDYDFQSSGYPGDLFGYSVAIRNNNIIVGTPYGAYTSTSIISMSGLSKQGLQDATEISNQGGAGTSYVFQKDTLSGWSVVNKLKPSTIISSGEKSDRFGWSISTDADFVAISAPGHDGINEVVDVSGSFVRKEFDAEFEIGSRQVNDIDGASGIDAGYDSMGAVYTYENSVIDWPTRTKEWTFKEKIVAQGYENLSPSGNFGNSVSISRYSRSDSDYVLAIGSHTHMYGVSGSAPTLINAGAAYAYDGILRKQPPVKRDNNSWIDVTVFGDNRNESKIELSMNNAGDPTIIESGTLFSDRKGQIFLEASGQDSRDLGYISQRPFLYSVEGFVSRGTGLDAYLSITTESSPFYGSGEMNLVTLGPDSDILQESMNIQLLASDLFIETYGSGLVIHVSGGAVPLDSGVMNLHTSGIGFLNPTMPLRVRGK